MNCINLETLTDFLFHTRRVPAYDNTIVQSDRSIIERSRIKFWLVSGSSQILPSPPRINHDSDGFERIPQRHQMRFLVFRSQTELDIKRYESLFCVGGCVTR